MPSPLLLHFWGILLSCENPFKGSGFSFDGLLPRSCRSFPSSRSVTYAIHRCLGDIFSNTLFFFPTLLLHDIITGLQFYFRSELSYAIIIPVITLSREDVEMSMSGLRNLWYEIVANDQHVASTTDNSMENLRDIDAATLVEQHPMALAVREVRIGPRRNLDLSTIPGRLGNTEDNGPEIGVAAAVMIEKVESPNWGDPKRPQGNLTLVRDEESDVLRTKAELRDPGLHPLERPVPAPPMVRNDTSDTLQAKDEARKPGQNSLNRPVPVSLVEIAYLPSSRKPIIPCISALNPQYANRKSRQTPVLKGDYNRYSDVSASPATSESLRVHNPKHPISPYDLSFVYDVNEAKASSSTNSPKPPSQVQLPWDSLPAHSQTIPHPKGDPVKIKELQEKRAAEQAEARAREAANANNAANKPNGIDEWSEWNQERCWPPWCCCGSERDWKEFSEEYNTCASLTSCLGIPFQWCCLSILWLPKNLWIRYLQKRKRRQEERQHMADQSRGADSQQASMVGTQGTSVRSQDGGEPPQGISSQQTPIVGTQIIGFQSRGRPQYDGQQSPQHTDPQQLSNGGTHSVDIQIPQSPQSAEQHLPLSTGTQPQHADPQQTSAGTQGVDQQIQARSNVAALRGGGPECLGIRTWHRSHRQNRTQARVKTQPDTGIQSTGTKIQEAWGNNRGFDIQHISPTTEPALESRIIFPYPSAINQNNQLQPLSPRTSLPHLGQKPSHNSKMRTFEWVKVQKDTITKARLEVMPRSTAAKRANGANNRGDGNQIVNCKSWASWIKVRSHRLPRRPGFDSWSMDANTGGNNPEGSRGIPMQPLRTAAESQRQFLVSPRVRIPPRQDSLVTLVTDANSQTSLLHNSASPNTGGSEQGIHSRHYCANCYGACPGTSYPFWFQALREAAAELRLYLNSLCIPPLALVLVVWLKLEEIAVIKAESHVGTGRLITSSFHGPWPSASSLCHFQGPYCGKPQQAGQTTVFLSSYFLPHSYNIPPYLSISTTSPILAHLSTYSLPTCNPPASVQILIYHFEPGKFEYLMEEREKVVVRVPAGRYRVLGEYRGRVEGWDAVRVWVHFWGKKGGIGGCGTPQRERGHGQKVCVACLIWAGKGATPRSREYNGASAREEVGGRSIQGERGHGREGCMVSMPRIVPDRCIQIVHAPPPVTSLVPQNRKPRKDMSAPETLDEESSGSSLYPSLEESGSPSLPEWGQGFCINPSRWIMVAHSGDAGEELELSGSIDILMIPIHHIGGRIPVSTRPKRATNNHSTSPKQPRQMKEVPHSQIRSSGSDGDSVISVRETRLGRRKRLPLVISPMGHNTHFNTFVNDSSTSSSPPTPERNRQEKK
ncbi:uncharacterized protein BDR25DRAFT_353239 [Lindgomyces ingoldianus]|uniref:Uncharacterized protein n=1 Tax=Lindgomyces ingoldianus TaxID=673940 RepID=A0ACB6R2A9_9PLEO|nr:uncharacterized protein BDR25DRAFT_353239 [Lindgomyces ingoldianus]KAF2472930.1 hypothetical protein BDR25DRAFT_353239 [Lindgomyces ingoldianus]